MTCGRACGDAPFLGNDQPPTVQPYSAFTTLIIHRALATNFEIRYQRSDEMLKPWNWKIETVVDRPPVDVRQIAATTRPMAELT